MQEISQDISGLLPVNHTNVGDDLLPTINMRDLWEFLGVKTQYADWIKNRIESYGFQEDIEFITLNVLVNSDAKPRNEFYFTIKSAMVVATMERRNQKALEAVEYLCDILGERIWVLEQKRKEYIFGENIIKNLFSDYTILPQFRILEGKYIIDWYIPELKLAIEFDEERHLLNEKEDRQRQMEIEELLSCRFIRYKDWRK